MSISTRAVSLLLMAADPGLMRVRLKADGKSVFLHRNDGVSRTFPEGAFFTTEEFLPGCSLEIEAIHPDLPSAKASTVVPEAFPEYSVELEQMPIDLDQYYAMSSPHYGGCYGNPDAMRIRLTFTDDPSNRDYYAVWIIRDYFDGTFCEAAYRRPSACMVAFSDMDFSGETVTKEFMIPYYPDDDRYKYHMELLRMSEECWRCVEAQFYRSMNEFAQYGQAAVYPYTNVIGGVGAFGALSPITFQPLELPLADNSLTVSE